MEIILARHAETIWNEQLRYIGRTDLPLSELGRKNAAKLARFLDGKPIDRIFVSSKLRAIETATAVARGRDIALIEDARLNEVDFGAWEGKTYEGIAKAYPGLVDRWINNPLEVDIPNGEAWDSFIARVLEGWRELLRDCSTDSRVKTVLAVTHAGCIKAVLGFISERPPQEWWAIRQDKGALNYIAVDDDGQRIIRVNDTDYRGPLT